MTTAQRSRKERALEQLKAQLESGVKTKKGTFDEKVELSKKDKTRIEKEIKMLKEKLN